MQEILVSKLYVVENITNAIPPKCDKQLTFEMSTKTISVYDATAQDWVKMSSTVFAATSFDSLNAKKGYDGELAVVVEDGEGILYTWIGDKETGSWIACGGSGSIEVIAGTAAPTVEGKQGDLIITSGNNVLWYHNGTAWVSTQELINIDYVYVAAGNIKAGDSFEGKTNQEMWQALLQKEINPTVTQPSGSLSVKSGSTDLNSTYQEIGSTLDLTIVASYSDGQVKDAWGSNAEQSASYAGAANKYTWTYTGDNTSQGTISSPVTSTAASDSHTIEDYIVASGTNKWASTVSYDAGTYQPKTNYGNNYGSTCASGTTTSAAKSFTGVYPVYSNKDDIAVVAKSGLGADNRALTFTMPAESSYKWTIAVPSTWNNATKFETADVGSTSFKPMGGGAAESLALWSSSTVTKAVNDNQPTVSYKEYVFTGAAQGVSQLKVTF